MQYNCNFTGRSLQSSEVHIEAVQSLLFSSSKVWCKPTLWEFLDVWQVWEGKGLKISQTLRRSTLWLASMVCVCVTLTHLDIE